MRRCLILLVAVGLLWGLAACGEQESAGEAAASGQSIAPAAGAQSDVLVAYFSATGNTRGIARHLQTILGADLYEITPEEPYTEDDLNYSSDGCRANREQNDPAARPAIAGTVENMAEYEVVFLGYPIWWGQAPKILYTFLECYDFDGVTIVPFCTSGSSGIGDSADRLAELAPGGHWRSGQRFSGGASEADVADWVSGLAGF